MPTKMEIRIMLLTIMKVKAYYMGVAPVTQHLQYNEGVM